MRTRGALAAFLLMLSCVAAGACQNIVQTSLAFADGSAALDPVQIEKLVNWLDEAKAAYPTYAEISVEAGASMEATGASLAESRALAGRRAESAAKAMKMLFSVELPLAISFHPYRKRKESPGSTNDFASIQLYPDLKRQTLPDCNPSPIPGFTPARRQYSPDPNAGASQSPR